MSDHIWMWVTQDKYRLPLAVADTARELAEIAGTTKANVLSTAVQKKPGRRYIRVDLEENIDSSTEREK